MTTEAREFAKAYDDYMAKLRHKSLGIRPDGRYCLACGKPLYGPDLSHTPPAQPSAVERWRQ